MIWGELSESCLQMEAPKSEVDLHGSLLHEATVLGDAAVVDVLLRTRNMEPWVGGLTAVTSKDGTTPLHVMARANDGGALMRVFTEHASVVRRLVLYPPAGESKQALWRALQGVRRTRSGVC